MLVSFSCHCQSVFAIFISLCIVHVQYFMVAQGCSQVPAEKDVIAGWILVGYQSLSKEQLMGFRVHTYNYWISEPC